MAAISSGSGPQYCPSGEGFRQYLLKGGCPGCRLDPDNNGYDKSELQVAYYQYLFDEMKCDRFSENDKLLSLSADCEITPQQQEKMANLGWFDGDGIGIDTCVSQKDLADPTFAQHFETTALFQQSKNLCERRCPRA